MTLGELQGKVSEEIAKDIYIHHFDDGGEKVNYVNHHLPGKKLYFQRRQNHADIST